MRKVAQRPTTIITEGAEPVILDAGEREINATVERLRGLLSDGDVEAARALAREMQDRWPGSDVVRYWARVLAPPEVSVEHGERSRPLDRERAWLRQHADEYSGCWLAVYG